MLRPGEKIEDLDLKGLKIIQNKEWFCFGIDAVLLADFANAKRSSKVVDFGTGTGI
ncbi:MAG: SAM-dependent methyltransferase, partial [Clostridium sp.]